VSLANTISKVNGSFTQPAKALLLVHGALVDIGEMTVTGGYESKPIVEASLGYEYAPDLRIHAIRIDSPKSKGLRIERSNVQIDKVVVDSLKEDLVLTNTVSDNHILIDELVVNDEFEGEMLTMWSGTEVENPEIRIASFSVADHLMNHDYGAKGDMEVKEVTYVNNKTIIDDILSPLSLGDVVVEEPVVEEPVVEEPIVEEPVVENSNPGRQNNVKEKPSKKNND
jgi:hypothetical protein